MGKPRKEALACAIASPDLGAASRIKQLHVGDITAGIAGESGKEFVLQPHSDSDQILAVFKEKHLEEIIVHPIHGATGCAVADTCGLLGDVVAGGLA